MPSFKASTEVTLFIGSLQNQILSTSIRYLPSNSHDVYIIGRLPLFLTYIQSLLEAHASDTVTVILIYDEINLLLEVLSLLRKTSSEKKLAAHKDRYLTHYKNELARVSGNSAITKTEVKVPQGHGDVPLGYNLSIVQLCDDLDQLDHLSESNVALQQLLRFIAMMHGGTYAAISGLEKIAKDGLALALLANDVVNNSVDPDMHIYDVGGSSWGHGISIHQLTPPGWDSWSKIELTAKSIPRSSDKRMLDSDDTFFRLHSAYIDYFAQFGQDEKEELATILATFLDIKAVSPPPKHPTLLTYDETVSRLHNRLL